MNVKKSGETHRRRSRAHNSSQGGRASERATYVGTLQPVIVHVLGTEGALPDLGRAILTCAGGLVPLSIATPQDDRVKGITSSGVAAKSIALRGGVWGGMATTTSANKGRPGYDSLTRRSPPSPYSGEPTMAHSYPFSSTVPILNAIYQKNSNS